MPASGQGQADHRLPLQDGLTVLGFHWAGYTVGRFLLLLLLLLGMGVRPHCTWRRVPWGERGWGRPWAKQGQGKGLQQVEVKGLLCPPSMPWGGGRWPSRVSPQSRVASQGWSWPGKGLCRAEQARGGSSGPAGVGLGWQQQWKLRREGGRRPGPSMEGGGELRGLLQATV